MRAQQEVQLVLRNNYYTSAAPQILFTCRTGGSLIDLDAAEALHVIHAALIYNDIKRYSSWTQIIPGSRVQDMSGIVERF